MVSDMSVVTVAGAVYSPAVVMVPVVALPPSTPATCHVTAVLVEFVTVAVNWTVWLTFKVAVVGVRVIATVEEELLFPPQPVITNRLSASTTTKYFIVRVSWVLHAERVAQNFPLMRQMKSGR
jgi:hypothetical protein